MKGLENSSDFRLGQPGPRFAISTTASSCTVSIRTGSVEFLRYDVSGIGYYLMKKPEVLVIGPGDGLLSASKPGP